MEIQIRNHRKSLTQRRHRQASVTKHAITGEQSLSGSSSVALRSLLRPHVVKMSLAAETRYLCVQTNAEADTEAARSQLAQQTASQDEPGRLSRPPGSDHPSSPPQSWHR